MSKSSGLGEKTEGFRKKAAVTGENALFTGVSGNATYTSIKS